MVSSVKLLITAVVAAMASVGSAGTYHRKPPCNGVVSDHLQSYINSIITYMYIDLHNYTIIHHRVSSYIPSRTANAPRATTCKVPTAAALKALNYQGTTGGCVAGGTIAAGGSCAVMCAVGYQATIIAGTTQTYTCSSAGVTGAPRSFVCQLRMCGVCV